MRGRIRLILLGLILASLAGCGRIGDFGAIVRGNRLYRQGDYQEAAASYLGVRSPAFRPVLAYDLANVYARLGEEAAAAELYEEARKGGDGELRRWAWYNQGVVLYEKGRYEEAYRAFRSALTLDAQDEDARRNLELAWRAWRKESMAPPERAAPASRREGGTDSEELRLLRRLETGRWRAGNPEPALPDPEDY